MAILSLANKASARTVSVSGDPCIDQLLCPGGFALMGGHTCSDSDDRIWLRVWDSGAGLQAGHGPPELELELLHPPVHRRDPLPVAVFR